ncbi:hypothetical protein R1flu_002178 [Riccia fluitans]|uniref:Uncharacterized protein n=1 Tax=Riccia fluitans TaxID=41844 RepID=A0ABD1Y5D0_9MARC
MTLQSDKTMLFLRSVDPELQEKLELLLEDKEADERFSTNWKDVEDAVGLIAKHERRREKITIRRFAPKLAPTHVLVALVPIVQLGVLVAQVRPTTPKKDETALEEIMRGMRDLNIKLARLEEKASRDEVKPLVKQNRDQRCIWCDSLDHMHRECKEFADSLRQGVVFWKHGRIALRESCEQQKTNFNKGGMKKIVEDYLVAQVVTTVEVACYRIHECVEEESLISNHVESSDLWSSTLSLAKQRKTPR